MFMLKLYLVHVLNSHKISILLIYIKELKRINKYYFILYT